MSPATVARLRPATPRKPTLAADLEELVNQVPGIMTIYPAYPRWKVSHFADERILTNQTQLGWAVTVHIGVTATSSARAVSRNVWGMIVRHIEHAETTLILSVDVKVCSIG